MTKAARRAFGETMITPDPLSPAEDRSNAVELSAEEHAALLDRDGGLLRALLAGGMARAGLTDA